MIKQQISQWFFIYVTIAVAIFMVGCSSSYESEMALKSDHFQNGQFVNTEPFAQPGLSKTWTIAKRFFFEERINGVPQQAIPLQTIHGADLQTRLSQDTSVYRLGHSSLLLELAGQFWLTDPMFSKRASPVQWAGPKRFHPSPISIEALPTISGVIISHDHYDHLDEDTIKQLHEKVHNFYVPLGVGQYLLDWGVDKNKVHEFDWWQEKQVGPIKLVSTPANHFSGRGLLDRNRTLWSSWVIQTPKHNLFFSGDSGYFSGFKKIGEKYGPFDVTFMENGAYAELWKDVHMSPEESIQAHLDVKGKVILPIHNGTFELAFHSWLEPFEKITELAKAANQPLATPIMGQRWKLNEAVPQQKWWQQ